MIVIFDTEIFIKYLKNNFPKSKSIKISTLIRIFENPSNKLVFTQQLVERIEKEFISNPGLLNLFQVFLKDISDNNRYIIFENVEKSTNDECILAHKTIISTEYKFILLNSLSKERLNSELTNCTCYYSNIKKPNKCWLIFNILSNMPITVRYNDFSSNKEIEKFFETIFNFLDPSDELYILDSYCNIQNHKLFNPIRKKGIKINVNTSSFNKNSFEIVRLRSILKEYFGKKNTYVKFSSDKKLIHERTIAFKDIVIESNHDFAEIKKENQNWKLDISISNELKYEIINKCSKYI